MERGYIPILLDQLDNLRSNSLMHPERRMQTIQPKILIHRNPARSVKRSWCGRPIHILCAICRGILIRASLWVSAWMLKNTRENLVGVEDERCGIAVLFGQGSGERHKAIVPICYIVGFE